MHPKASPALPLNLTYKEKLVLRYLQADLPLLPRPYAWVAGQTGCSEDFVLQLAGRLLQEGVIRRLGATLQHEQAGYVCNAMLVFDVSSLCPSPDSDPSAELEEAGRRLAAHSAVSHCYLRALANPEANSETDPDVLGLQTEPQASLARNESWGCCLFAMLHALNEADLQKFIAQLTKELAPFDLPGPRVLKTLREMKKTAMQYF